MSVGSRSSRYPGETWKTTKSSPSSSDDRRFPARARVLHESEHSWFSSTPPRNSGVGVVNVTSTGSQRHSSAAVSYAREQENNERKPTAHPQDEAAIRIQLNTATAHLSILCVLRDYKEYDETRRDMSQEIKRQQDRIRGLEEQLRAVSVKVGRTSSTRLQFRDIFQTRRGPGR